MGAKVKRSNSQEKRGCRLLIDFFPPRVYPETHVIILYIYIYTYIYKHKRNLKTKKKTPLKFAKCQCRE